MKNFSLKKYLPGCIMGLLILIPGILGWWEKADLYIYDNWFSLHGKQNPGQEIVIVGMDEKSISQLGPLPWGRDVHARLLQQLSPARVVGFDILFDTARDQAGDQILAAAIKDQGHVVLASLFTYEPDGKGGYLVRVKPPLNILAKSCASMGFINMGADQGNIVHRTALFYPFSPEKIYPSFNLAIFMASRGLNPNQLSLQDSRLLSKGLDVPVEKVNQVYPNFWGPGQTFTTYSYIDVLTGQVAQEALQDKIVLVGPTSPTEKDYYDNPYTKSTMLMSGALPVPGVEINANVVKSLITGTFFRRAPAYLNVLILILAWLLVMLGSRSRSPWKAFILTVALALGLSIIVYVAWLKAHYWINLAAPLLIISATYIGNTADNLVRTNLEKKRIRAIFSRYVSPAVVDSLMNRENNLELGGSSKEVTILFSDIRSFTSYSEGRPAQEVVGRLNEYFTAMTDIIFRHGGTLDKYLGDGLLAYFGAPLPLPDHAGQALKAAAEMLQTVENLNKTWQARGEVQMNIGIGIHSGLVVVGNIGSLKRMEYTIIGENVNLASRLEGLNKELHEKLIFSQATCSLLKDLPSGWNKKSLGEVQVRGLNTGVAIYTLMPEPGPVNED